MKENKKVSVIMGIYNCASTLPDAIDSIVNQTYTDWELIMCDDCSTDNTYEVASQYQKKYPEKIILIRNEKNMHLAYSLNRCLERATGKYVARMDGDDKCLPERFEIQIDYLESHPDVDLVGTEMRRFDKNGIYDVMHIEEKPDRYSLRYKNPFFHATIIARKSVYDVTGGYLVLKRTNRCEDYDLWFRFFHEGLTGINIKEDLYLVREDMNAIKRRTIQSRIEAFNTTVYGFRLLNYPLSWMIESFAITIVKILTPRFLIYLLRKYQAKRCARD